MQVKALLTDDDAVSPVIGVILMVAITVILAAVIASFVLGLGPGEAAPSASFDYEYDGDAAGTITVTHATGAKIDPSALSVQLDGAASGQKAWTDGTHDVTGSQVATGDSTTISTGGATSGTVDVRIVWESGDTSSTIDQGEVSL